MAVDLLRKTRMNLWRRATRGVARYRRRLAPACLQEWPDSARAAFRLPVFSRPPLTLLTCDQHKPALLALLHRLLEPSACPLVERNCLTGHFCRGQPASSSGMKPSLRKERNGLSCSMLVLDKHDQIARGCFKREWAAARHCQAQHSSNMSSCVDTTTFGKRMLPIE